LEEIKDPKKDRFSNYETIYIKFPPLTETTPKLLFDKVKIGKYWFKNPWKK